MADFSKAHAEVMGNEGGYANNPADAGGETYKGIARKFWPQWRGWESIDRIKSKLVNMPDYGSSCYRGWVKVLNRTAEQDMGLQAAVRDFYKVNFWDKYRCGEIVSQAVATWLYDHAVNARERGVKWMQEAAGVTADGSIGPLTLKAINGADPATLLQDAEDVAAFYRLDRAVADPSQIQFLPSWLRRDGVSEEEVKQVMAMAKDGLTYTEAAALKQMINATA